VPGSLYLPSFQSLFKHFLTLIISDNMKVMLSNTPVTKDIYCDPKTSHSAMRPSTGIIYLGSMLGKQPAAGFPNKVADVMLEDPNKKGMDERIARFGPDVFGITVYESNIKESAELISQVKDLNPQTLCFAGGPAASAIPNYVLRMTGADAVFQGEADITLRKTIEHLAEGKRLEDIYQPGVLVKGAFCDGASKAIPKLTREEYEAIEPDLSLIRHLDPDADFRSINFAFSRGCPYQRCSFCQLPSKGGFRYLSVQKTIRLMHEISLMPNVEKLVFGDGTFSGYKDGARRILEKMIAEGISFKKGISAEIAVDLCLKKGSVGHREIDPEFLKLLSETGMSCELETESLSSSQIEKFNLPRFSFKELMDILAAMKPLGIEHSGSMMLSGFDTTCEDVLEAIHRYFELKAHHPEFELDVIDSISPYVGTGEYGKFMAALKNEAPGSFASAIKYNMVRFGGLEDIGQDEPRHPYLLKTAIPLNDPHLLKAMTDPRYLRVSDMDLDPEMSRAFRLVMLLKGIKREAHQLPIGRLQRLDLMIDIAMFAASKSDVGQKALLLADNAEMTSPKPYNNP